jgi:hypothetical protein
VTPVAQNMAHLILTSMSLRAKRSNLMIAPFLRDCFGTACLAMTKEGTYYNGETEGEHGDLLHLEIKGMRY